MRPPAAVSGPLVVGRIDPGPCYGELLFGCSFSDSQWAIRQAVARKGYSRVDGPCVVRAATGGRTVHRRRAPRTNGIPNRARLLAASWCITAKPGSVSARGAAREGWEAPYPTTFSRKPERREAPLKPRLQVHTAAGRRAPRHLRRTERARPGRPTDTPWSSQPVYVLMAARESIAIGKHVSQGTVYELSFVVQGIGTTTPATPLAADRQDGMIKS